MSCTVKGRRTKQHKQNTNADPLSNKTTNIVPLKSLPNSIIWNTSQDGRINFSVRTELLSDSLQSGLSQGVAVTLSTPSDIDCDDGFIPESVQQYQRQLRRVQANERSTALLNMEDHLRILYEDEHLIVVNKPSGVLCVPGLNHKPNLLDLVCQHLIHRRFIDPSKDNLPPSRLLLHQDPSKMIVHRLDMDTSGVVLFSKSESALKILQAKFRDRSEDVVKEYQALVCGHMPVDWQKKGGDIYLPLQRDHRHPPFMRVATPRSEKQAHDAVADLQTHGFRKLVKKNPKPSHTEFHILGREWLQEDGVRIVSSRTDTMKNGLPVTRVQLIPHTGRTHQLRVHMAALGYPILGDPAYGLYGEANPRGGCSEPTQGNSNTPFMGAPLDLQKQLQQAWPMPDQPMCLHAFRLGMNHPIDYRMMMWEAEVPF